MTVGNLRRPESWFSKHTSNAVSAVEVNAWRTSPAISLGRPCSLPIESLICSPSQTVSNVCLESTQFTTMRTRAAIGRNWYSGQRKHVRACRRAGHHPSIRSRSPLRQPVGPWRRSCGCIARSCRHGLRRRRDRISVRRRVGPVEGRM